ncbi:helix-turn-helix domain-containing protein [Streptomyces sp. NPDC085665]|uniref:helix-turn-helix domain-containing protein n=1 Tax=Streptomyces sp. NPDC085665 TaxID=3365735 RepID=UPI0037D7DF2C
MRRTNSALAEHTARGLAQWLLSLRQASGLTISQVASRAESAGMPASRSTLYRAELVRTTGRRPSIPAWPVVEAYTKACGGSIAEAKRLWTKAAGAPAPGKTSTVPRRPAMAPQYISEPADLLLAMRELRLRAGNPSLRELEKRATPASGTVTLLPRSTLSAVLNGTRPCRRDLLADFVRACGVTKESEITRWLSAWDRIEAARTGTADHDLHQRVTALEEDLHHTQTMLATVLLPNPRPEAEPLPAPDTPAVENPQPRTPQAAVTEPAASAPAGTKRTPARRPKKWLSGLVRGITGAAGASATT